MKKFTLALILIASMFAVSSCSKDDNNDDYPLNGTTWIHNDVENDQIGTLKFSETTFSLYYTWTEDGKTETDGGTGTYTYSAPNVILKANGETETVVLKENTITTPDGVFKKQ